MIRLLPVILVGMVRCAVRTLPPDRGCVGPPDQPQQVGMPAGDEPFQPVGFAWLLRLITMGCSVKMRTGRRARSDAPYQPICTCH